MNSYNWAFVIFGFSGWVVVIIQWLGSRVHSVKEREDKLPRHASAAASVGVSRAETNEISLTASTSTPRKVRTLVVKSRGAYALILICLLAVAIVIWRVAHSAKGASILPNVNISPTINITFIPSGQQTNLPEPPAWQATTIKTVDSAGNDIEVVVGVLWDPYRWVKGSARYVAIDEAEKETYPVEDVIKDLQPDEKRPIIVIGLASHENAREHPDQEIVRARDRADRLVQVCGNHFTNKPHIYSLNLGAYNPDRNPNRFSATERRVVLAVINRGENSPELLARIKPALVKAWQEKRLMLNAEDYSLFKTPAFQLNQRENF